MANLAMTTAKVSVMFPKKAEIYDFVAAEALVSGCAVFIDSSGNVGASVSGSAAKDGFRGIALNPAAAGQAVSVLKRGHLFGFTLTSLAYDALVYISTTAGALSAGSTTGSTLSAGIVVPMSDPDRTKVLYISADWLNAGT